jgi:ribosome-interacting GTPase 1
LFFASLLLLLLLLLRSFSFSDDPFPSSWYQKSEPEKLATQIMREYRITSADLLAREDITVDQLVDVIVGNRVYKPCCYFYNKIDTITIEEVDQLARMPHTLVGSVKKGYNIGAPDEDDPLKAMIWKYLGLTRIYTKRKGQHPDLAEPVVLSAIRKVSSTYHILIGDFSVTRTTAFKTRF